MRGQQLCRQAMAIELLGRELINDPGPTASAPTGCVIRLTTESLLRRDQWISVQGTFLCFFQMCPACHYVPSHSRGVL